MNRDMIIRVMNTIVSNYEVLIEEDKMTIQDFMAIMNQLPLDVVEELTISDSFGAKINDYNDSLEN